jgi:hypothetical protein
MFKSGDYPHSVMRNLEEWIQRLAQKDWGILTLGMDDDAFDLFMTEKTGLKDLKV